MNTNPEEKVTTKMTLELPAHVSARMKEVQEMAKLDSLTDVIRHALALYDTLVTSVVQEGGQVVLYTKGGDSHDLHLP